MSAAEVPRALSAYPDDEWLKDVSVLMPIGGRATRAHDVTHGLIPKHLIELDDGRAVLDVVLEGLQSVGFRRFVFCVGVHADQITQHLSKDNWRADDSTSYDFSAEEVPLGVDGAILQAIEAGNLRGQGMIVPGDVFLPWESLAAMNRQHANSGADVTMGVTSMVTERTTDLEKIIAEENTDRLLWCYGRDEPPCESMPGLRKLTSAAATTIAMERYAELCNRFRSDGKPVSFRDDVALSAARSTEYDIQVFDVLGEILDLGTPANIAYGQAHWSDYV